MQLPELTRRLKFGTEICNKYLVSRWFFIDIIEQMYDLVIGFQFSYMIMACLSTSAFDSTVGVWARENISFIHIHLSEITIIYWKKH